MSLIHLTTVIHAPVERVFDLSRSVSLHKHSMDDYGESAVAGRMGGLFELNDTVTWKAKHLGKVRRIRIRISAMDRPDYFKDEMLAGDFKSMQHEHYFKPIDNGTIMIDQFSFECPYGIIGKWLDYLYLHQYMKKLLLHRNAVIKEYAESKRWMVILG